MVCGKEGTAKTVSYLLHQFEDVNEFMYINSKVTNYGRIRKELRGRINQAQLISVIIRESLHTTTTTTTTTTWKH